MDLAATYVAAIEASLSFIDMSHKMAHVWGGLLLYGMVASLAAGRLHAALPFAVVALAEFVNELLQAAYYGSWRIDDTLADVVWTLALPALLLTGTVVVARGLEAGRRTLRPALG